MTGGAFCAAAQNAGGQDADSILAARKLASQPRVKARFVPDSIGIGDRFTLEVEIEKDIMQPIAFPQFKDGMLGEIIEIMEEGSVDTLQREGRRVRLGRKYGLQIFEEGYFNAGRFPMLYGDKNVLDTVWSSDSLKIKVGTFEIDTLTQTIHDIKPPVDMPLRFGEFGAYLGYGLLVLGLCAVLVWWLYTRRRNLTITGKPKQVEPPHIRAIRKLEAMHNQKLWQNDRHKLYYTAMTDILREYIEHRYGVRALEMTSEEIAASLEGYGLPAKCFDDLRDILAVSDLVKFAKFVPVAEKNEDYYLKAYYFVEETKPAEEATDARAASDDNENG